MSIKKVLLTGAGAPGAPGIIECLKQNNLIDLYVADADKNASGFYLCDQNFVIPKATENHFLTALIHLIQINSIEIVIPIVTKELELISQNTDLFAAHNCKVVVSHFETLKIANNKLLLFNFLNKNNIETASYFEFTTIEQLENVANKLEFPVKPIVVKPASGNGSRGVRIIDENKNTFELLMNEKPNNYYTTLENYKKSIGKNTLPSMIAMEYLPGEEYSVDTFVIDKKPIFILPRLRIKQNAGITIKGKYIEDKNIIEQCKKIIHCFDFYGPIGFQFKADINNQFRLLEINPRLQGTTCAAMGLGLNIPELCVYPDKHIQNTINWGLEFTRIYKELFK